MMIKLMPHKNLKNSRIKKQGFALVEVLLSLTILAIAGTALMRSFQNGIETTGRVRDLTKIVYLTESKLHELEMEYDKKHIESVILGELRGNFENLPGAEDYVWRAYVELDPDFEAYLIRVQAMHEDTAPIGRMSNRGYNRDEMQGFWLKTIVPAARINHTLLNGGTPGMRENGRASRGGQRGDRGGSRGGSRGGGRGR